MKKKQIIMLITCLILVIAGISYSCTYQGLQTSDPVITTLSGKDGEGEQKNGNEVVSASSGKAEGDSGALSEEKKSKGFEETSVGKTSMGKAEDTDSETQTKDSIYVHLCGAVMKPQVYRVGKGTRLVELIELAGGLTLAAAGDYVNQAVMVEDGQRIYIPTIEEVEEQGEVDYISGGNMQGEQESDKLININLADATALMSLPGIGQAKASSIIEYRNTKGKFQTIEDLMNVPGIKEGLFGQISSYITVK